MFKKPFSFTGRIRRTEYLISFIIVTVLNNVILHVIESSSGIELMIALLYIPSVWFLIAQSIKRAHDIDDSAWWLLFPLYPFWLLFSKGNKLANRYGLNPRIVTSV